MEWSDLSFKEKKQIYDSIKAQNPDTTYLDIKSQFDSIPAYEDGGKKIMPPKELGLTPGTPEYYKRQQQISGKAELVQPRVLKYKTTDNLLITLYQVDAFDNDEYDISYDI